VTKPFNMALFLSGALIGSKATQQRHLRQARVMQVAIQQRWRRDNPWTWQLKHVHWFLVHHLALHSPASKYYYRLTVLLILKKMGRDWSSVSLGQAKSKDIVLNVAKSIVKLEQKS
jgi:hypothetical protein